MKEREKFASRLGFILISAGCAIGLGNVWRFPYIAAQYGGGAFILIYLVFLTVLAMPIMSMEFAVGRASRKSVASAFRTLEPKGTRWHWFSFAGMAGNYLFMMFYTVIAGWMVIYFLKMLDGAFNGMDAAAISAAFPAMQAQPIPMIGFTALVVVLGFGVCAIGLQKGVERINKVMMVLLIGVLALLAVRSVTLPGAAEGLRYYLVPDLGRIREHGIGRVLFEALGQAFFTLSVGMGSMAIFGSYLGRERRLMGESLSIMLLDTFVAVVSGLIIIPACFAYDIPLDSGASLIFVTLPNLFNAMPFGQVWGTLFFLFMIFAALSTVIAVFENIVSFAMDLWGLSRRKACVVNIFVVLALGSICALGFNVWSGFAPLGPGTNISDFADFLITNNILPLGALVYLLFCTTSRGWGWQNFLKEVDEGEGLRFPAWARPYLQYVVPVIVLFILVQGYIAKFS